jgi:hypothetical protein
VELQKASTGRSLDAIFKEWRDPPMKARRSLGEGCRRVLRASSRVRDGGYDAAMDRTEPVSRFMRRMEALDLRLRPAELAELASARFATSAGPSRNFVAREL